MIGSRSRRRRHDWPNSVNKFEYSHNLEKDLEDLEKEMETLNGVINKLLKRVSKQKDRGIQTLPKVQEWISMAEETESKASSLLDESISGYHDLSTNDDISKISESTLHYSKMVCMTLKEVKALSSNEVFKVLVERTPLSYVKKMLPLQPIVSRKMLFEKAWKCLMGNECRTLGLYGIAGVGKTTLLTQLKNKFTEDGSASSLVISVGPEEEIEGIQHEIGKRLGLSMGRKDKQEKASEIFEILNVQRFVLLLDGIHKKVDLEEIGVPAPTRRDGCKIVFTTRSQETCKRMRVDTQVEVKCLSPEEAWDFFQEIVGETTLKSHPDIPQLARIVAKKCSGLPIALSLMGGTMSHKRTVREWHHAVHVLVSATTEFSGTEAELLPILKFTYDNLHGESIRSCFLYCALFPKSCDISKQDLVDCWIAEGMIEEEDREIAEIKGLEMIADLVMLRLLIDDESGYGVSMHGMVREMALCIVSNFGRQNENFVAVGGMGIHQLPKANEWRSVRRMSVTCTQVERIYDSPDCPELTTLFLQENNLRWVSGDFFRWMKSLVVLNLSRNRELTELPEEVSSLVSLRLLNLSWTRIKGLPLGLKELKRLIHLDLEYTPLLREVDVIGYLLNLQVLRLLQSGPMDLSLMENIQLLRSLKELSLTVREVDFLKRLLSIHQLASCIRHLQLIGITITDGGTLLFNSMLSLRELNIGMCDIPEMTINWRSTIQGERVHFGNILQNIRTVFLSSCKGLRDLTWLLLAPNLDNLRLHECQQIERIINKEKATADMTEQPFQNLTSLSLDSLPQLESIYWTPLPFPVLKYVYIRDCPKLRIRPFSTKGNQVLSDVGQKEVEREDEATKQHLSSYDDRDFLTVAEDQKMDGLASGSHPNKNIALIDTPERGESTNANSLTDFDDRDFQTRDEDQKMDGLGSESHPIEEIVLVETLESRKGTTTNSITGENVFQSRTHATMEHTQTYPVLTPVGMISNMTDTPGTTMTEYILSFGVQKLLDLLGQEREQFQGGSDQITKVRSDLNVLKSYLEDANAKKHTSSVVRNWVEEIKEIVFDAEDIIETYLLKGKFRNTGGIKRLVRRLAGSIPEFDSDMNGISMRISKIISDMQAYGVQQVGKDSQPLLESPKGMRQEYAGEYETDLVGLEENVEKLVNHLVEEHNIQVVSITGMGGLGKTTLARQIFNHEMVKNKFDRFAWVCISQVFNRKIVWQMILRSLMAKGDEANILKMTESELQEQIFRLLEASKSLIVIDDIWKEDWKLISPILPNTKGWKVLLTSRNEGVAGDTRHINFKLNVLTSEDSWTLFQKIAFPRMDAFGEEFKIDEEMEEMGKHMISHCGGLPLPVRVLGGLLATKYTVHEWKRISENVGRHLMGGTDGINDSPFHVMSMSFEELPIYLKHCFLYFAIYPEDYQISVEVLSYYWAAEGFTELRYHNGETIRDVGDNYIEEFVRRNMVISERDTQTLRFETCRMHDMMREMCLSKAKEENFLQTDVTHSKAARFQSRRFVWQNTTTLDVERDINRPNLRSFLVILNPWENFCTLSGVRFTRLQLLRVLDLNKARFEGWKLPADIGKLIHLRYLSLESAEVSHLPSLRKLKLLIYLNIDVADIFIHVPNVLMEMKDLRYLVLPTFIHEKTKLELSTLVNLETLKNFSTKNSRLEDLHCMTRLRTLSINVSGETSSETLSLSIAGLRHLENLVIYDPLSWIKEGIVLDFDVLKKLELFMYRPIRLDNQRFPSHLTYISLTECRFEEDLMPLLEKLQHLRKVKLLDRSHCARRMVCSGSGFPQLRELDLVFLEQLEEWIIEEGSMPLLHTLDITNCNKLKELPDGLRFIISLQNLTCYSMGKEWEGRLSEGGEEYYKVHHIPSVKFYGT